MHTKIQQTTEIRMVKTRVDGSQVDLGVVTAEYKNPIRQLWWTTVGRPRANARIRRENRRSQPRKED